MGESDLIYFDIAAVVVMLVSLVSFLIRLRTRTPANRMYLSALVLVTLTAFFGLTAEVYDIFFGSANVESAVMANEYPPIGRGAVQLIYYALRSLTAPAYMVLIATVSDTSHRLNQSNVVRAFLWVPMLLVLAFVVTNPLHHLVFASHGGVVERGPGIMAIYASTAYYSAIGIWWLIRWKRVLSDDEFATLMMLYPLVLLAVFVQYNFPHLHVEMFATSVAIMLVSAFVIRPERQTDSLVQAASLQAYRDMCNRCFVTQKPLCLVYLEIIHMERLRTLVGKDELQTTVSLVAANLNRSLESGDVLFYLRNGLFCISPANLDEGHALAIAQRTHEEGRARAMANKGDQPAPMEMRSCVVRVPQDVSDIQTLSSFVRRFGSLVPTSRVTSFSELSRQSDFEINMALSSCVQKAIHNRSFEVYFQPILTLADNRFHSAEALVRLHDPQFGWIPPSLFIPEAEQSGAIVQIGSILLEKICAFLSSLKSMDLGLSYVEINLSTEQCVRPHLAHEVLGLLEAYDIEPSYINLEITETSSAFSQHIVEGNVRSLAEAGVSFSLDDFGSGYSNVTRVLALPFDLVKFDKSFVDAMDSEATSVVLAQSISMMKQIGKKVLVEGVENADQANMLRAMGADYIQGYLYAKPLPQDEFVAFLLEHNAR